MEINEYIDGVKEILDRLDQGTIESIITKIQEVREAGKRIYVFGNGGSAITANHLTGDIIKATIEPLYIKGEGKPIKALCLTDSNYFLTAWANDIGYDSVFGAQIMAHVEEGDLIIAISGSGNSENVLFGVGQARQRGAYIIGLTGFDGGQLKREANEYLIVPSNVMEQIEDIHLMIGHIIALSLRN